MTRNKPIAALLGRVVLFSIIAGLVGGCVSSTGPESTGGAPEAAPAKGCAPARDFEANPIDFTGIKVRPETRGAEEWSGLSAARLPLDLALSKWVMEVGRGKPRFHVRPVFDPDLPPPPQPIGTISGTVVPSVYALVSAYVSGTADLAASVHTDPATDGFLLADLSPGTYDLEASAPGYESGWEWAVVLAAGETSGGHVLELIEIGGGEKR